jgi:predicted nucleotidyltransferase
MNEASQQRLERARSIAAVYASHPNVEAIVVGGSVARDTAHERSDIDLGLFWSEIAPEGERSDLIAKVGGKLRRRVDNALRYSEGNPRRQGCIEIVEIEPTAAAHGLGLDLEHETVAGTERVLDQVIDKFDLSLEKQELLSVIQDGIALYGHDRVAHWREKTRRYPGELERKMVTQNLLGISRQLLEQVHWIETGDWFCLYEGYLNVGRRLLLALMALNRVWAFTDNPNFGGFGPVVERFALKPERFADRLSQTLQSEALHGIEGFAALHEETLRLVEAHLPAVDTSGERGILQQLSRTVEARRASRPVP